MRPRRDLGNSTSFVHFVPRKSQLRRLLNHFNKSKSLILPILDLSLLRLSQSCDKLFRKRRRRKKKRQGLSWIDWASFDSFRGTIYSKVFVDTGRQDGSQVDLTLRVIAHTFEQGTEQKVRHLFMTRPLNFNIFLLFFFFFCIIFV